MRSIVLLAAFVAAFPAAAAPAKTVETTTDGTTVCLGPFSNSDTDRDRYARLNRDIAADLVAGGFAVDGASSRWGRGFKTDTQQVIWMDHGFGPCLTFKNDDAPQLPSVKSFPDFQ